MLTLIRYQTELFSPVVKQPWLLGLSSLIEPLPINVLGCEYVFWQIGIAPIQFCTVFWAILEFAVKIIAQKHTMLALKVAMKGHLNVVKIHLLFL